MLLKFRPLHFQPVTNCHELILTKYFQLVTICNRLCERTFLFSKSLI